MRNIHPHQLPELLRRAHEVGLSVEATERLSWIAYFVEHHGSASETCAHFEISRSTLHRWLERFDPANFLSLEEGNHAPHGVRQPMVPAYVVALIRRYREQWPLIGKEKVSKLLKEEHGVEISASGVGRVIERECLYFGTTPLHWRKRIEGKNEVVSVAPVQEATQQVTHAAAEDIKSELIGPRLWRKAAIALSIAAHVVALTFAAALLWESAGTNEETKAAASGQILQSNLSSLLSVDE